MRPSLVVAVVVAAVVVNDVVVPLLVVAHADNIQSWSIDVQLRLLKGNVEFLWVGGWGGMQSHLCVKLICSCGFVLSLSWL